MTAGPPWLTYDPDDPAEAAPAGEASLVVLLATPGGADGGWSGRVAVSLARAWSARGDRVCLVDVGVSHPTLHAALGQPLDEGVSDVLLYGASLRRVARPSPDGFLFASAGTPAADARPILTSERWDLLARGFGMAGARLVAFLSTEEPGFEELLARANEVVVLAARGEPDALQELGALAERVTTVLCPPGADRPVAPGVRAAASGGVEVEGAPAPAGVVEAEARSPAAREPAPPDLAPPAPEAWAGARPMRRNRSILLAVLAVVILLALLWALGLPPFA